MSDHEISEYTGFDRSNIIKLVKLINVQTVPYDLIMDSHSQLVLTLLKYRQGLIDLLMEKLYKIHIDIITKIFLFWTNKMCEYFKSFDFWSLRSMSNIKYSAIIQFTEIIMEKSRDNIYLNNELYSRERDEFTLKFLSAIDENSVVIFCSDVYGGSSSNEMILRNTNFFENLGNGNVILMGTEIQEVKEESIRAGIHIEVNESTQNKENLDHYEWLVMKVKSLTKKYKLLSQTVPIGLWVAINEIVYNINMLNNLEYITMQ